MRYSNDMKNALLRALNHKHTSKLPLLDIFAAGGLLTVFVTRAYLALLNYPQLGGETLHIAHMLWGGLLLALVLLYLALADTPHKVIAMLLGGVGFGLFIDELGKFITVDNDYFFKPAASLIIMIFIIMWVGLRAMIARHEHKSILPGPEWPTRSYERVFVYVWLIVQTLTIPIALVVVLITGMFSEFVNGSVWVALAYVAYTVALFATWVLITRGRKLAAANLIRTIAAIDIVILSPINFYISQFGAAVSFIVLVLLIIATSKNYEKA